MPTLPFADRLAEAVLRARTPACVGLDPHLMSLPPALLAPLKGLEGATYRAAAAEAARTFCCGAIEAVAGQVAAVKPQVALFEALGSPGVAALEQVVRAARAAGLLIVLDAKRGDIGSTAEAYAAATLDDAGPLACDAVTLSPYLGPESLAPFLSRCDGDKGIFLLLRTSNPGAGPWQVDTGVAARVAEWISAANQGRRGVRGLGPVGAVVGANVASEVEDWRRRLPAAWFLVPGYGAQGGVAADVGPHFRRDGLGALVVSARGVLFPPPGDVSDAWREGIAARTRAFVADLRTAVPL
jgi:orotidine-5'-phosphate decarboxylase